MSDQEQLMSQLGQIQEAVGRIDNTYNIPTM
jgi:hypothetical protein